ncbi:MAG: RHS repeat-associated core domain-containing protein [Clostridia bacterium]|nr:RHS repeat-associated core domain-containing protein [Clostridia bacterium]
MSKKLLSLVLSFILFIAIIPILKFEPVFAQETAEESFVRRYTQEELREMYERKREEYFPDRNNFEESEDYDQSIIDEINNNIINDDSSVSDAELGILNIQSESDVALQNPDVSAYSILATGDDSESETSIPPPTGKVISKVYNANESVSLGSGALNYTYNILSIPGRNGLDLDISLRYNSADAIVPRGDFSSVSYPYWAHDYNKIATGWSFVAPNIFDVTEMDTMIGERIRFADGSSYALSPTYELEGYELDDVSLTREDGVYILTYSNGIKEYFENTYGTLVKREDRFGNEIVFEYETFSGNSGRKIHVPRRIIDTVGNIIDIDNDFITYNGRNYLSQMTFSIGDTVYSTVNFDTFGCADIEVGVIESIEDAEGNVTTFEYIDMPNTKEYRFDERPNGRSVLLSKVTLPTGGVREYEYTKHMRSYNHYYYYSLEEFPHMYYEKHDVYKVSLLRDSDGQNTQYWYVGDLSGYPSSYPDTFHSEPKGYIHDEEAKYHTITYHKDLYTIYTFDYKHNLVSECSYTDFRMIPYDDGYIAYDVLIGNNIYKIGQYHGTKSYADPYSMSYITEPISDPPEVENEGILVSVKTHGNFIYAFWMSNNTYIAKEYNTLTDEWSVAGSTERLQSDGNNLTPKKFLYAGGMFYAVNGIEFLIYDTSEPIGSRFERFSLSHSVDVLTSQDEYIYYKSGSTVYKYNLSTKTAVQQYNISSLSSNTKYDGFHTNDALYIYEENSPSTIYEVDFSSCTLYLIYMPSDMSATDLIKGYDGNMYYLNGYDEEFDMKCIYRFSPDSSDIWDIVSYRMINDTDCRYLVGNNIVYIFHDVGLGRELMDQQNISNGIEIAKLSGNNFKLKKISYAYNEYDQMTSESRFVIYNDQITHLGTVTIDYVPGYNVVGSETDIEGNVTNYDYTNSPYFIPVSVTEYSGTSNALTTTNTLSSDKSKILSSSTQYDDRTLVTEYEYSDAFCGNVEKAVYSVIIDGDCEELNEVSYIYDISCRFVEEKIYSNRISNNNSFVITDLGVITESYTYDLFGNVLTQTDNNDNTTSHTYDKIGRLTRTTYPDNTFVSKTYTISPEENKIRTSYNNQNYTDEYFNDFGRIDEEYYKDSDNIIVGYKEYWYDCGRLAYVIDGVGNQTGYFYDEYGRVVIVDVYNPDNPYDMGSWVRDIIYDDMNFKITESTFSSSKTSYYDIAGRKIRDEQETDAGLNFVNYEYDYMGNLIKTTDAKGNVTENIYNDMGQLIRVEEEFNFVTEYEYDLRGNVEQVKYNGKILSVNEYDNFNRLIKSTDNIGNSEYYTYDSVGNVIKYKDRNMNVTTNEYDNMYRLTETQTENISVEYTYDSLGNILTMTDSTGITSYSYMYGNIVSSITTPDNKTINYSYDLAGNVYIMTDYDNNEYAYTYDQTGRIDTIMKNDLLIADYDYTYNGSGDGIEKITYPEGTVYYTYDNAMRVTDQTTVLSTGEAISALRYTYDVLGNVTKKYDELWQDGEEVNYTYNELNQLCTETDRDGTVTEYRHDIWDNIWAKITIPSSDSQITSMQNETHNANEARTCMTVYYNHNNLNQLISSEEYITDTDDVYGGTLNKTTTFTYDANGNMLTKRIVGQDDEDVVEYSYTYNPLNQLTEFEDANGNVTTYAYDGTGMRVSKTQGENVQKFYWDRGYVVNESLNGTFTASNSVGTQGIFARTTGSGENAQINFLFKNAHGDVTDVVSDDELTNEYDYDAYGNQKELLTNDTNPFRYSGEYYDSESGLIYLRNRYYDPEIERFITEDPIQDGMNWYAYCGNNPVMFVDPLGLNPYTNSLEDMNCLLDIIWTATGDDGYTHSYDEENERYELIYCGGNGDSSGGSVIARGMVNMSLSEEVNICVSFSDMPNNLTTFYTASKKITTLTLSKGYIDRNASIRMNRSKGSDQLLNFFHELDHALDFVYGIYNRICVNEGYYSKSKNIRIMQEAELVMMRSEASAITVANAISDELGLGIHSSFYSSGFYMDGLWYQNDKPEIYGAFPYEYTNGMATIFRSYGPNKPDYYRMRG